jgi:hypothetical protein
MAFILVTPSKNHVPEKNASPRSEQNPLTCPQMVVVQTVGTFQNGSKQSRSVTVDLLAGMDFH